MLWYVDDNPAEVPGTSEQSVAVHGAVREVQSWFSTTFGRDGWDGDGGASHAFVHIVSPTYKNAHWVPHYNVMMFGDRFASADLVAHEFTHSVIQSATYELVYAGQSGALNESLADVFTYFMFDDWEITDGVGAVVRDLAATNARTIADTMADFIALGPGVKPSKGNDYGHVHYNCGIPSRVAHLLATGGPHWDTGVSVVAVDKAKLEQIWYRALQLYFLPTSSFEDARYQLLAACESLASRTTGSFGIDLRDCGSILNAFNAVGVGEYDSDRDTWHDGVDNCLDDFNPDQLDTNGNGAGDACETDTKPPSDDRLPYPNLPDESPDCPTSIPTGLTDDPTWQLDGTFGPRVTTAAHGTTLAEEHFYEFQCTYRSSVKPDYFQTYKLYWQPRDPKVYETAEWWFCDPELVPPEVQDEKVMSTTHRARAEFGSAHRPATAGQQLTSNLSDMLAAAEAVALPCP